MKDFIKFTFASCLGVMIAMFALMVFFSLLIGGLATSMSSQGQVSTRENSVLELNLNTTIPEHTNNTPYGAISLENPDVIGLHDMARVIRRAATDENISALYIRTEHNSLGLASSSIIMDAIEDFRESGKPIVAYGNYYTQTAYLVASAADRIFLCPTGGVEFRGFGTLLPFFKNTLDAIGVEMQIYYAGDYKSATEPYRRTEMSEENREQTRAYLHDVYRQFLQVISDNRDIRVDHLWRLADNYEIRMAEDALREGLVDELAYSDAVADYIRAELGMDESTELTKITLPKYRLSLGSLIRGSEKDRIAVLYAEGDIVSGEDMTGQIAESDYIKELRQIGDRSDIKALVIRVNSPGGSGLVSDNLLHEIKTIQDKGIPVVVSMGDYAASGGYYISASADRIIAQPNTLTGSIGVYGIIPNVRGLLEDKIGLRFDTVGTGQYANRLNVIYKLNDKEDRYIQQQIDAIYDRFLKIVAEGRGMTTDEVHKVAQGRIWTGQKAVELGLVDEVGDLDYAIRVAADLAQLDAYKVREYPSLKNPLEQMIMDLLGQDMMTRVALSPNIEKFRNYYDQLESMIEAEGPQMRLPYLLDIQ